MNTYKKQITYALIILLLILLYNNNISNIKAYAQGENSSLASETDATNISNTFESYNYKISFKIDSKWDNGYNATITITNTSDISIENWCISFPLKQNISNIWNATIIDSNEDFYIIKNLGWNQDIQPGESISFGITCCESFTEYPEYYTMIGNEIEITSEDFSILYEITDDWGSGFKAQITITNNKDTTIEDWCLNFKFGDNKISQIWNAIILSAENEKYCIGAPVYNQNITLGQSVTFGFLVESGCSNTIITDFVLTEHTSKENSIEDSEIVIEIDPYQFTYNETLDMLYTNNYTDSLSGTISTLKDVDEIYYCITTNSEYIINEGTIAKQEHWKLSDIGLTYGINNIVAPLSA